MEYWTLTSKNLVKLKRDYYFHAEFLEEVRYLWLPIVDCMFHRMPVALLCPVLLPFSVHWMAFFYICRNRMEMSPFFIWLLFYLWRNISPRTALHHGNDWFVTRSVSTLPLWFGTIVGHVSNSIAILALCWSRVDTAVISLPLLYLTGSRAPHWSSLLAALNLLSLDKTWGWLAAFLSSCNECDWYCFLSCGLSFLAVSSNTECLVVQGTWDSWSLHQVILEASLQLSREGDL